MEDLINELSRMKASEMVKRLKKIIDQDDDSVIVVETQEDTIEGIIVLGKEEE